MKMLLRVLAALTPSPHLPFRQYPHILSRPHFPSARDASAHARISFIQYFCVSTSWRARWLRFLLFFSWVFPRTI